LLVGDDSRRAAASFAVAGFGKSATIVDAGYNGRNDRGSELGRGSFVLRIRPGARPVLERCQNDPERVHDPVRVREHLDRK
jgi:hypothetical protein